MSGFNKKHQLLFLSILSFVFVATTALALSGNIPNQILGVQKNPKSFAPLPVLSSNTSFPIISALGTLAVDEDSGVTLYEKNANSPLLPASTTKIITAMVAMDYYQLDAILTIGNVSVDGQKMGLREGEQMRVEDLLYGLLVYSANDAGIALAQNFPGGVDSFVSAMNTRAAELSLKNTKFKNPVGLDGDEQVTTARDLVEASKVAMQIPEFAKIVGTKEKTVNSVDGKISHKLVNINQLLGKEPGVLGVKTGWTENARENLVTYIERDNHKIMIAMLGSQDRFGETKELINWIFGSYSWQEVKPVLSNSKL